MIYYGSVRESRDKAPMPHQLHSHPGHGHANNPEVIHWNGRAGVLQFKPDVGMYLPVAGKTVEIRGVVRAASPTPRPGSVPYKDHIVMAHLAGIESTDDPAADGREAVAFVWSMRDNVATAASRYRAGDAVRLRPWADVAGKYEAINRSELEDGELLLAEPAWGQ